jgi:hypothetical protein
MWSMKADRELIELRKQKPWKPSPINSNGEVNSQEGQETLPGRIQGRA